MTQLASGSYAAEAESTQPVFWLSTGDSYSAGEGVLGNRGSCAQSDDAWGPASARLLQQQGWQIADVAFSACTSHLAEDFYNRRHPDRGDQWEWALEQSQPPDNKFDVITMSYGGNDIGFADVVFDCIHLPDRATDGNGIIGVVIPGVGDDCDVTEQQLRQRVDNLINPPQSCGVEATRRSTSSYECEIVIDASTGSTGSIVDFWIAVADRSLTPDGRLVVVGYPALFADSSDWGTFEFWRCNGITRGDANMLGRGAEYFDNALKNAVNDANQRLGADKLIYVSVVDAFRDNGLCSDDPWINSLVTLTRNVIIITLPSGAEVQATELRWGGAFHPTATAHAAEAQLVADALANNPPGPRQGRAAPEDTTPDAPDPVPDNDFCRVLIAEQDRILQGLTDAQAEAETLAAQDRVGLALLTSLGSIDVALAELRVYFERLNSVAPSTIEADVQQVADVYQAADESAAEGFLAALEAVPALERINVYALETCGRGV